MRGVLFLVLLGVAIAPAQARQSSCWPAGSSTVVATNKARVYVSRGEKVFACSYRFRRRVRLDDPYSREATAPYALNRRYVVHGANYCEGAELGCFYAVVERDLRTGRMRFHLRNGEKDEPCDTNDGDCGLPVALQVQLRRDGSAAWIACNGNVEEPPYESECNGRRYVQIADGHGARIADRGRIPPHSLHFSANRRRVSWTNDGKRRSAPLYFSAAGQTIR